MEPKYLQNGHKNASKTEIKIDQNLCSKFGGFWEVPGTLDTLWGGRGVVARGVVWGGPAPPKAYS